MSRFTSDEFVKSTMQDESSKDFFQLECDQMFKVNLDSMVWVKAGTMVAYVVVSTRIIGRGRNLDVAEVVRRDRAMRMRLTSKPTNVKVDGFFLTDPKAYNG